MKDIFYNQSQKVDIHNRNLPHWQQKEKMHFVTFRTYDSIPEEKLNKLKEKQLEFISRYSEPYTVEQEREYRHLFFEKIDEWMDNCYGECLLKSEQYSSVIKNALEYYDNDKYKLDHWVVMPNHVHVLLLLVNDSELSEILHGWKSFTANQINKKTGNKGQFWQHESFDHIVRDEFFLDKYRDYIVQNKSKCKMPDLLLSENKVF